MKRRAIKTVLLTPHEEWIIRALAQGYDEKQIAEALVINISSVNNRLITICKKYGFTGFGRRWRAKILVEKYLTGEIHG